jgi:hypothetical protein
MRLLSQKIGRRANQEDHEVGKFWQARYRAVRLLDETAVLACAVYVDLNPIRASIATTIETSDFTSGQQRALAIRAAHTAANQRRGDQVAGTQPRRCSVISIARSIARLLLIVSWYSVAGSLSATSPAPAWI